jgi:PAS domain S-box-containing protein
MQEVYEQLSKKELIAQIKELKNNIPSRAKALNDQELTCDVLFHASSELIYLVDQQGCFLMVNDSVCKKYGYKREELIGKYGDMLSAPGKNDLEKAHERFVEVLENNKTFKYQWWSMTKDGVIFPKEFTMRRVIYEGQPCALILGRDTSEHNEFQEKMMESEKRYRSLFERNLAGIYRTKPDGEIVDCNQAFANILGYDSKDDLIGKVNAGDLYVDKENRKKNVSEIIEKHSVKSNRIRLKRKDGDEIWVLVSTAAIENIDTKEIEYLEGTFIDITDQVKIEEMLKKSQESYRSLLDSSPFGIVLHDEGRVIFANKRALEMMGVNDMFEMEGVSVFDFLFDEDHKIAKQRISRTYAEEELPYQEYRLKRRDNLELSIETRTNLIEFQGKKVLQISFHDITKVKQLEKEKLRTQLVQEINNRLTQELEEKNQIQKKLIASEEKLKTSLQEKEVLLKEVHHRVKNNLQVISSIFNLQKNYSSNQVVKDLLVESQNRIKSMAFIHESLYKTVDFAKINFSEYTENLCYNLLKSYNAYGKSAELKLQLKEVFINLDFAIPCGLILNELITNAIKYAFEGREHGVITVNLSQKKNNIVLKISDDGVGIPKDINFENSNTLGFQLVNALVSQINGSLSLKVDNGTKYEISFKTN